VASANKELLDAAIRHAHALEQFKNGTVAKILGELNRNTYPAIIEELQRRLARIAAQGYDRGVDTTKRLRDLAKALDVLIRTGMDNAEDRLIAQMHGFAQTEAEVAAKQINRIITSVELSLTLPSPATLRAMVESRPFAGELLADHFQALTDSTQRNVRRALNYGLTAGETFDQITARVQGTAVAKYRDGALEVSRRHVRNIVGTAVQHVGNAARQATYRENADIVKGEKWTSTLDSRTCFPAGTMVATDRGPRPIESLRIGDQVLTIAGRFRRVIGRMSRSYSGAFIRVTAGGRSTTATADHLFHNGTVWRELREFKLGDSILQGPGNGRLKTDEGSPALAAHFGVNLVGHLEQWVTTLDVFDIQVADDESFVADGFVVHNCPQCQALDGEEFEVGEGPIPPVHLGPCRCVRVPVLKSWQEMGFDVGDVPAATRSSLNGEVPDSTTYGEWIKGQSASVQDEALGPERAALLRSGEVSIDSFVDDKGRLLTLEELRRIEGLD